MTLATFNPPRPPHAGTKAKSEFKLLKAEFGDGYTQTARDGLNHIRQVATLTWDRIPDDDAFDIVDFVEEQGGDRPFLYALPGQPVRKWTCEECELTRHEGFRSSVQIVLRQSFALS